ncbi:BMP family protein [Virgibacillus sp. 179-BFC.A HS]|uniref:BMP family protein n=1 Tax=Tigheibacillus jepli TaxID=3035914 RepID=A0ABU5CHQ4_9BACI|nr:BMP family protein [Virgibacillus sp. 179-BFC.A HS]MDY0405826.1 BMP family protein [Virgibacillus sp. 179-BFC.A HS]
MKKRNIFVLIVLLIALTLTLAACGNSGKTKDSGGKKAEKSGEDADYKAAMVTDVGGIDDKSFNQSSWEGLQAWGKEHGYSKGNGFDYAQSTNESDYMPNLNRLVRDDYNLIFGIGFNLKNDIEEVAKQFPDTEFAIVDDVVEQPNVVSINFKEQEGSFLVGVAAAKKTKTNKVGFVGGVESPLIQKFESGFVAGVKSVNPDIKVDVQYAASFAAPDKGKIIASNMYNDGVDVIYHSSGGTGNGVFNQAKDIKQNDPDRDVWVIGVDRDQHEEGQVGDHNVTLTSMVKRVDIAVQDVANKAMEGKHLGGETLEFGLKDEGISVAMTNKEAMTDDIVKAVEEWKEKILNGDVKVPKTRDEVKEYEKSL